jgi:hypothetical protein
MHLLSADGRKPLQKLIDSGTLVEVLKEGGNRQTGTAKAPCPPELAGRPVDSAAATPVHMASLSLIATGPSMRPC